MRVWEVLLHRRHDRATDSRVFTNVAGEAQYSGQTTPFPSSQQDQLRNCIGAAPNETVLLELRAENPRRLERQPEHQEASSPGQLLDGCSPMPGRKTRLRRESSWAKAASPSVRIDVVCAELMIYKDRGG